MELNKQVLQTFLREAHVRDFEMQEEPTSMHRLDYVQNPQDPNIFEFKLTFMFAHFGTQIDGVIEASILVQNPTDTPVDVMEDIKKDEDGYAIPLYSKASAVIAKLSEDRGSFPLIVPVDHWFSEE